MNTACDHGCGRMRGPLQLTGGNHYAKQWYSLRIFHWRRYIGRQERTQNTVNSTCLKCYRPMNTFTAKHKPSCALAECNGPGTAGKKAEQLFHSFLRILDMFAEVHNGSKWQIWEPKDWSDYLKKKTTLKDTSASVLNSTAQTGFLKSAHLAQLFHLQLHVPLRDTCYRNYSISYLISYAFSNHWVELENDCWTKHAVAEGFWLISQKKQFCILICFNLAGNNSLLLKQRHKHATEHLFETCMICSNLWL